MTPTRRLSLAVHGLGCGGGGAHTIEKAVARVAGVTTVYVNPASETAYIEYRPDRCSQDQLRAAVESAGYRVRPHPGPARPTAEHREAAGA